MHGLTLMRAMSAEPRCDRTEAHDPTQRRERVTAQCPSRDLQTRFALYALARLPAAGFVLDYDDLSRWLLIAGYADDSAPTPTLRRSWLGRLLGGFGDASSQSTDA